MTVLHFVTTPRQFDTILSHTKKVNERAKSLRTAPPRFYPITGWICDELIRVAEERTNQRLTNDVYVNMPVPLRALHAMRQSNVRVTMAAV